MMSYDLGIHRGAHILPNGVDCAVTVHFIGRVIIITAFFHKSIQFPTFLVYLYYKYSDVQDPAILNSQEKVLHKIAITMGATVGISQLLFMIHCVANSVLVFVAFWLLFFIQLCVITSHFMCTKKMKALFKEYFAKDSD